jgi:hypothetical protein
MIDLKRDAFEGINDTGNEFRDLSNVLRQQFENNRAFNELRDKAVDTGIEQGQKDALQLVGNMQVWLDGLIGKTMLGEHEAKAYLDQNPSPEIPAQFASSLPPELRGLSPEAQNALLALREIGEKLQLDSEKSGARPFVITLSGIQGFIRSIVDGLAMLLGFKDAKSGANDSSDGKTPEGPGSGDGKDISETERYEGVAAEALRLVFTPDVIANWHNMTMQQRADHIVAYATYLNNALGISINAIRFEDLGSYSLGYRRSDGLIGINTRLFADGDLGKLGELIDTITHEARHQFQAEVIANPERFEIPAETVAEWKADFENYISPQDDFEGYYKQSIEKDAREFAENVMRRAGINLPKHNGAL